MTKLGRPTKYSNQLVNRICNRIALGEGLNSICENEGIHYTNVLKWLRQNQDFRLMYTRARQDQQDFYADKLVDLAINVPATRDEIEKAKLISSNLMWIASKLKPRVYGDKVDFTSAGERIEIPIYGGLSVKPIERKVVDSKMVNSQQLIK